MRIGGRQNKKNVIVFYVCCFKFSKPYCPSKNRQKTFLQIFLTLVCCKFVFVRVMNKILFRAGFGVICCYIFYNLPILPE